MRAEAPGLAADRTAVEHQAAQPLRGRIDGGGQARRPGPHHQHVVQPVVRQVGHDCQGRRPVRSPTDCAGGGRRAAAPGASRPAARRSGRSAGPRRRRRPGPAPRADSRSAPGRCAAGQCPGRRPPPPPPGRRPRSPAGRPRRRMKARMRSSPISALATTSRRSPSASIAAASQPCGPARHSARAGRPLSWPISPVNSPVGCRVAPRSWPRASSRRIWRQPDRTRKAGVLRRPIS